MPFSHFLYGIAVTCVQYKKERIKNEQCHWEIACRSQFDQMLQICEDTYLALGETDGLAWTFFCFFFIITASTCKRADTVTDLPLQTTSTEEIYPILVFAKVLSIFLNWAFNFLLRSTCFSLVDVLDNTNSAFILIWFGLFYWYFFDAKWYWLIMK